MNTYDSAYNVNEQLPRNYSITFKVVCRGKKGEVLVLYNEEYQLGDIINDNGYENDYYRYHDVFHYTFATMLGWSPCSRAMMKRKRKSNPEIDEFEDGARATITEEAISLILFNEAKAKNFYTKRKVSKVLIDIIKRMTNTFEVRNKTEKDWEEAIIKGYELFRKLKDNNGGKLIFDMMNRKIKYVTVN